MSLSLSLFLSVSACLSVCLSMYISMRLSLSLSMSMSLCVSVCISLCLCLSVCLSVCLSPPPPPLYLSFLKRSIPIIIDSAHDSSSLSVRIPSPRTAPCTYLQGGPGTYLHGAPCTYLHGAPCTYLHGGGLERAERRLLGLFEPGSHQGHAVLDALLQHVLSLRGCGLILLHLRRHHLQHAQAVFQSTAVVHQLRNKSKSFMVV